MNIFVTGACGFIGSHLVEKLVKKNYNVKALTFYNNRNNYGWLENLDKRILKNVSIVTGDIRDQDLMIKYTKKMDVVIHLAALISIPYSYLSPQNYIDTNIHGTHNILLAAKKNKLSKVIITSTSEVYGNGNGVFVIVYNKVTNLLGRHSVYYNFKLSFIVSVTYSIKFIILNFRTHGKYGFDNLTCFNFFWCCNNA